MGADPWLVLGAALVEGAVGYPKRLHARLPHPVAWAACLIQRLEQRLNRDGSRRAKGVLTLALVTGVAVFMGWSLQVVLGRGLPALILAGLVGALGLAARNLHDHVRPILRALEADDLPAARRAVSNIVGRDTAALDASGVAAAAIESLAESFNDGVIAPLFWFLVGGLPGLFAYKTVNTADSLIGHIEEPYRQFGWAAARTDDLMNLIPARLSGLLVAAVAGRGLATMLRDAGKHPSPNAGWPEAAMAGALGVQLGGAAVYEGVYHARAELGAGPRPTPAHLRRALTLYGRACILVAVLLLAGGFAWPR